MYAMSLDGVRDYRESLRIRNVLRSCNAASDDTHPDWLQSRLDDSHVFGALMG